MRFVLPTLLALAVSQASTAHASDEARLLRFPDIARDRIAFVHGGDIYTVGRDGGEATRLTSDIGDELYPKFSPDGQWIAFSAEYSGTRQVWVMPAAGGTPRQLTWYSDVGPMPPRGGTDYRVLDWTPDGKNVLVRANRVPYDERGGRYFLVPVAGGMEQPLEIPEGGGGMFSPDGQSLVYTPIDRENRTWKRYRGGRAQDVWVYDLAHHATRQLTDFAGTDQQPLWIGNDIYFTSDRGQHLNLYKLPANAAKGAAPTPVTNFDDLDVLWASAGPDAVVFEQAGWLWRYDVGATSAVKVPVRIADDHRDTLPTIRNVAADVESFALSPHGERAVFGARGEIFTVPAKEGEPRNLSRTPTAREISVSWSPDGRQIAYLSDASGEYEIYLRAADGKGEPRRLTRDGDVWRFPPVWSPDGKKLAYADKKVRLRYVDVASGNTVDVDRSRNEDISEYTWSPDGRYLVYTKNGDNHQSALWVYDTTAQKATALTSGRTIDFSPAFDPKGRYLYFLSKRSYNLTRSVYEENYLYTGATRIYAATLAADGPAVNRPKSDEVNVDDGAAGKDGKKSSSEGRGKSTAIDTAGFESRVVALGEKAGDYQALAANDSGVFFAQQGGGGQSLRFLEIEGDKSEEVASGVSGYALSDDGKKLLVQQGRDYAIVDAKAGVDPSKHKLNLAHLEVRVDPKQEWQQEYVDAWRILRDWFYDEGVHGGIERWNRVRSAYQPLVDAVTTRGELDYVFGEIAGEVNAGHVYVDRGPNGSPVQRKPGGFLGAEIAADPSGYWKIGRIFAGENWESNTRSPLTEPGVDVREGEFVIAIDGVDARSVKNFYQLLEGKADRVVELTVNGTAKAEGARMVRVRTQTSERFLRYRDWVESRRALVDRLSGGRIGYIHVPNTAIEGNRELAKGFAAFDHKDALLIDDRYNGGGFIPDRMIELVARQPLNYWKRRGLDPQATPALSHVGPKAMLINGYSSSGGDAFPYYFKKLKLGPVIGTRTWGGLIGLSGNPPLADGGSILTPSFRFMSTDGQWAVENEGVAPDVEVIDRPELIAAGHDPSIEKAVAMLLDELAKNPPRKPVAPPAPSQFGGQ